VEQVEEGEAGLQIYVEQVEQEQGGLQIDVEQLEQGQGVCPAEPLHLCQSGSTRPWNVHFVVNGFQKIILLKCRSVALPIPYKQILLRESPYLFPNFASGMTVFRKIQH